MVRRAGSCHKVGWTAYVPPGSVAKGREIVTTGRTFGELPRAAS
jgi:hypothetical protein